ncbi:MAG: tetratricopeptide repeat protein [Candidatus Omnitrophica bacterium]|nr:tetratricopeptide repeat protein [Candidatus Omnitrophota bacterium]
MSRKSLNVFFCCSLAALFLCRPCQSHEASEEAKENQRPETLLSLAANRSLLLPLETEYNLLQNESIKNDSPEFAEKLEGLGRQIQILKEDRAQLLRTLPPKDQANEFLKDLAAQKNPSYSSSIQDKQSQTKESADPPRSVADTIAFVSTNELHEKALGYVQNETYDEAVKIYEQIILQDPDDDEAYLLLGHLYVLESQYNKAKRAFLNAVHIDPQNRNEIIPFYENKTLQNPSDDEAYTRLGYAHLILEETTKAQEAFKEALSINPSNLEALRGLDLAYQKEVSALFG